MGSLELPTSASERKNKGSTMMEKVTFGVGEVALKF
jgi:hypothetical protein